MKIYLAGGGTGGHFYPLIAIARSLRKIAFEEKMIPPDIIFAAPEPYDKTFLFQEDIKFRYIPAGKIRRYFSFWNLTDSFKTSVGIIKALFQVYMDFPDVVFSKGSFAAFPVLLAAKILKIPVIIHESDILPGKVNEWAAKFAKRIAVSFPESIKYFSPKKTALVGNPVRVEILGGSLEEAKDIFGLEEEKPIISVLGGSQGAEKINDIIIDALPELVKNYELIHQAGKANLIEVKKRADLMLEKSEFKQRYHLYGFLDEGMLRGVGKVSRLIISRAGSGAIFEIANWGLPCILIPITESAQDHQRQNAYAYARTGAAEVIEEANLKTPHLLLLRISHIMEDAALQERMRLAAKNFAKPDAAEKIAREILKLGLEHA